MPVLHSRYCIARLALLMAALLYLPVGNLAAQANSFARGKLLLASDVHFNPMFDATLVPELQQAAPEQWPAILERGQPRAFSPYGQDTNWWLLKSALDAMRKTMPRPAVFIIDGDLLAHGFPAKYRATTHDDDRQHYRTFIAKTVQFLALQLRQRWPDTQILITPGNNDDDCQDYSIEAGGAFLTDSAPIVRDLAKGTEELAANWQSLGSYSVLPASIPALRIVSVNTVFFSAKYQAQSLQKNCADVQSTADDATFRWLQNTLTDAQQANQKVWLMFHIPPGIDGYASTHPKGGPVPPVGLECVKDIVPMWEPEWTQKFDSLVMSYRGTVMASFAGHTHTDDFRVIGDPSAPTQFVLIDPAISPVYGQNPAFRVIEFSSDAGVKNHTTYYLTSLTKPDKKLRGRWKKEYEFAREWKARPINAASLGKIYGEIASNETTRQRWLKLYNVSSDAAKIPPNVVPGLYCAIEGLGVGAYRVCACGTTQ
jgi:hypothetical protein